MYLAVTSRRSRRLLAPATTTLGRCQTRVHFPFNGSPYASVSSTSTATSPSRGDARRHPVRARPPGCSPAHLAAVEHLTPSGWTSRKRQPTEAHPSASVPDFLRRPSQHFSVEFNRNGALAHGLGSRRSRGSSLVGVSQGHGAVDLFLGLSSAGTCRSPAHLQRSRVVVIRSHRRAVFGFDFFRAWSCPPSQPENRTKRRGSGHGVFLGQNRVPPWTPLYRKTPRHAPLRHPDPAAKKRKKKQKKRRQLREAGWVMPNEARIGRWGGPAGRGPWARAPRAVHGVLFVARPNEASFSRASRRGPSTPRLDFPAADAASHGLRPALTGRASDGHDRLGLIPPCRAHPPRKAQAWVDACSGTFRLLLVPRSNVGELPGWNRGMRRTSGTA